VKTRGSSATYSSIQFIYLGAKNLLPLDQPDLHPPVISASGYQTKRGVLLIFAAELIAGRPKKISVLTSMDILLAPDKMFLQAGPNTPLRKKVFILSNLVNPNS
jgi:hypothetical protein